MCPVSEEAIASKVQVILHVASPVHFSRFHLALQQRFFAKRHLYSLFVLRKYNARALYLQKSICTSFFFPTNTVRERFFLQKALQVTFFIFMRSTMQFFSCFFCTIGPFRFGEGHFNVYFHLFKKSLNPLLVFADHKRSYECIFSR